jgi:hypothetical protein
LANFVGQAGGIEMTDKDNTWEGIDDIILSSFEGDGGSYTFEKSRSGGFNKKKLNKKQRKDVIKNMFMKGDFCNLEKNAYERHDQNQLPENQRDRVVAMVNGQQINDIEDPNVEGTCFFSDLREQASFDSKTHHELLRIGKEVEKGTKGNEIVNTMPTPMINAIVETLRYFGLSDVSARQAYWDLKVARFRIYDWLGMCYTGRLEVKPDSQVFKCVKMLVKLYIDMKDVGGFCWFLRGHDLEVEEPHKCEDCIKSYKEWVEEIVEQGKNPDDYS